MIPLAILTVIFLTTHNIITHAFSMGKYETLKPFDLRSVTLSRDIVEVIEGPLHDLWIILLVDPSVEHAFPLESLLKELHNTDKFPSMFLSYPDVVSSWQDELPFSTCGGQCVVLLLTGASPQWLQDVGDSWAPTTIFIVNVNTPWDSTTLMSWPQIQRATSLALMETDSLNQSHVFTSKPFFKSSTGKQLFKIHMGIWNKTRFPFRDDLFPDRFQTFNGDILHIASDTDDYPLLYGDKDDGHGMNINILESLGSWLNFSFTLQAQADDNQWGELENGTWIGMLGQLHRREKNLTINYFTVVEERLRDFDCSAAYFFEGFGFALRVPPPLPAWMSLTYPFQPLVWASICVGIFIVTLTVFIITRFAPNTQHSSFLDVAIFVYASMLRQSGQQKGIKTDATRMLAIFWWIASLILALGYTCNLIAVLTVPVFPPFISTIQELALSGYRVAMVDYGEFVPDALASSQDQYLRALGERMDLVALDNYVHSYEKLVNLSLDGRHAITETYSYLRNLVSEDDRAKKEIYVVKEQVYSGALAFLLPKHTPWTPKLSKGIRRVVEAGLVDKWYKDIMDSNDNSQTQSTRTSIANISLSLPNLQGPFFILGFGLILGLVLFMARFVRPKQKYETIDEGKVEEEGEV